MATKTITIPVDAELAEAYGAASQAEKQKIAALLTVWLREASAGDVSSLKAIMDEISEEAKARGLTPDMLDNILED